MTVYCLYLLKVTVAFCIRNNTYLILTIGNLSTILEVKKCTSAVCCARNLLSGTEKYFKQ